MTTAKRSLLRSIGNLSEQKVDGSENVIRKCNFAFLQSFLNQAFKVIMLAQRDLTNLEFNCNQRFKNEKTNLNICHPICSGRPHNCKTGHFTSWEERGSLQNVKKKMKKTRAKRAKLLFSIVKYANF